MSKLKNVVKGGIVAAGAVAASAHAAVDAAVTTAISGAGTDVGTIGAAVLVVMVGIKVYKWVRQAL